MIILKDDLKASRVEIIKKTLESVSFPIFLAGLTTVLGFLGLLSHILPKARELRYFCGIWNFYSIYNKCVINSCNFKYRKKTCSA